MREEKEDEEVKRKREEKKEEKESKKIGKNDIEEELSENEEINYKAIRNFLPISSHRGGRMGQRGRGREMSSRAYISRSPPIHVGLESSSEDEPLVPKVNVPSTKAAPRFKIAISSESGSDEEQTTNDDKATPAISMYDSLNKYVKALTLTPLSSNYVAKLGVKTAPNLSCNIGKVPTFVSVTSHPKLEENIRLEDESLNELMELPFGDYPLCVQNLVRRGLIPSTWTKAKAQRMEKLWDTSYRKGNTKEGLGFGVLGPVQDVEFCLMITNNMEAE